MSWRRKQIESVERAQARVVHSVIKQMDDAMESAVETVVRSYETTGRYHAPNLDQMLTISNEFYRALVIEAYNQSKEAKRRQMKVKKLAKGSLGLPKNWKYMEQLFGKTKYWSQVLKRSRRVAESIQKSYQQKLKKAFDKIVPALNDGEISPRDAKKYMFEAFKTSKSRVETIFRTETTNYFGRTQVAIFEGDDDIIGFLFDAVRDSSATDICRKRHGLIYRPGTQLLKDNTPALHYNCRSQLIPLANTPENRSMLKDQSRSPSNRAVPPLPPGWTNSDRSRKK